MAMIQGWTSSPLMLLTDLKNMAVCQEWDKHTENIKARFQFSKAYIWKITFHTVSQNLKQFLFEKMRRIDSLRKIVKYRASLHGLFNVYEFCCFNNLMPCCQGIF
jgi:integrase